MSTCCCLYLPVAFTHYYLEESVSESQRTLNHTNTNLMVAFSKYLDPIDEDSHKNYSKPSMTRENEAATVDPTVRLEESSRHGDESAMLKAQTESIDPRNKVIGELVQRLSSTVRLTEKVIETISDAPMKKEQEEEDTPATSSSSSCSASQSSHEDEELQEQPAQDGSQEFLEPLPSVPQTGAVNEQRHETETVHYGVESSQRLNVAEEEEKKDDSHEARVLLSCLEADSRRTAEEEIERILHITANDNLCDQEAEATPVKSNIHSQNEESQDQYESIQAETNPPPDEIHDSLTACVSAKEEVSAPTTPQNLQSQSTAELDTESDASEQQYDNSCSTDKIVVDQPVEEYSEHTETVEKERVDVPSNTPTLAQDDQYDLPLDEVITQQEDQTDNELEIADVKSADPIVAELEDNHAAGLESMDSQLGEPVAENSVAETASTIEMHAIEHDLKVTETPEFTESDSPQMDDHDATDEAPTDEQLVAPESTSHDAHVLESESPKKNGVEPDAATPAKSDEELAQKERITLETVDDVLVATSCVETSEVSERQAEGQFNGSMRDLVSKPSEDTEWEQLVPAQKDQIHEPQTKEASSPTPQVTVNEAGQHASESDTAEQEQPEQPSVSSAASNVDDEISSEHFAALTACMSDDSGVIDIQPSSEGSFERGSERSTSLFGKKRKGFFGKLKKKLTHKDGDSPVFLSGKREALPKMDLFGLEEHAQASNSAHPSFKMPASSLHAETPQSYDSPIHPPSHRQNAVNVESILNSGRRSADESSASSRPSELINESILVTPAPQVSPLSTTMSAPAHLNGGFAENELTLPSPEADQFSLPKKRSTVQASSEVAHVFRPPRPSSDASTPVPSLEASPHTSTRASPSSGQYSVSSSQSYHMHHSLPLHMRPHLPVLNSPRESLQLPPQPRKETTMRKMTQLIRKDLWSNDPLQVESALQYLGKIASDPEKVALIARTGGLLAIVSSMEQHTMHAGVQVAACSALEKLALDADNELAIGEVGGVEAIQGAMLTHFGDDRVQEAAWAALWNLSCGGADCASLSHAGLVSDFIVAQDDC